MTEADIYFLTKMRNAQITVGPSTIRNQPEGTKEAAVNFLKKVNLAEFSHVDGCSFKELLDAKTKELQYSCQATAGGCPGRS